MRQFVLLALITAAAILASPVDSDASAPRLINYQGMLADSLGYPLDTIVEISFTIYDAEASGNAVWTETQTSVVITGGQFQVLLGSVTGLLDTAIFGDTARWLGVKIGDDAEISPRSRLVSTPYSFRVNTIDGASGGIISGDVAIQSDLDLNGDLRVTGTATIGSYNTNTGASFVAGSYNSATGEGSVIGGGVGDTASGQWSVISGGGGFLPGMGNNASGMWSTISGGVGNSALGVQAAVSGGANNIATGDGSTVGGGASNQASGTKSTVPGGTGNQANGRYSFAAGRRAIANHDGSFVWSDSTDTDFSSTGDNQFLIQAGGGVGIGTNSPSEALDVAGTIRSSVGFKFPDGSLQTTAAAGGSSNWTVTDSVLYTDNYWGIARGGAGNLLWGDSVHTMVNLGVACTTGSVLSDGIYTTVGGGYRNSVWQNYATIGGGFDNFVNGSYGTVAGGSGNIAFQNMATVSGGEGNMAGGVQSAIGGGIDNQANGQLSTVGGGRANSASASMTTIAGGWSNAAGGLYSTVGGGFFNNASESRTTIGGGANNTASGDQATVGGGGGNTASGDYASVGGGSGNTATGINSTVPGGSGNQATGKNSFAAGRMAHAVADNSFIWNGDSTSNLGTTGYGQFLVFAPGGVGINVSNPTEALEVSGTIYAKGLGFKFPDGTIQQTAAAGGNIWEKPLFSNYVYPQTWQDSVGIGTSTPTEKLHVQGDGYFTGKLRIGPANDNSGTRSFVVGERNQASGAYSNILGGADDTASGDFSTVVGGEFNRASASGAVVGGGRRNVASGDHSVVAGGGSIQDGNGNSALGMYSTVSGGANNSAISREATVGGGWGNTADTGSTVGGGYFNEATGKLSAIVGGFQNVASGTHAFVGGGFHSTASGDYSVVAGGASSNTASGNGSSVLGGINNTAEGPFSMVLGGSGCITSPDARWSLVAGRKAWANYAGTFVWADSTDASFYSTAVNQFLIRAEGGVGIGTNWPQAQLEVKGGKSDLDNTEGDFAIRGWDPTNGGYYRLKIGVDTTTTNGGDVRIRAHGGTGRLILGSGSWDVLTVKTDDSSYYPRVGIGTTDPSVSARLHVVALPTLDAAIFDGNVGIGTTDPSVSARLHVVALPTLDAAVFDGNVVLRSLGDQSIIMELGEGLDFAEGFDVSDQSKIEPGSVMIIDPDSPGQLTTSSIPYDTKVAGIVAGANGLGSGIRLGVDKFDYDVALAGRVYCKVDASYGAIQPGDLLTTSPTAGHAMVVKDYGRAQGAILGKAMQAMSHGERGEILVLVTLQ